MVVEAYALFGHGAPVRLETHQVVIRNQAGTPICIAMTYGPDQTVRVAHARDPEFPQLLRQLGLHEVRVDTLQLPPPPGGARLLTPVGHG